MIAKGTVASIVACAGAAIGLEGQCLPASGEAEGLRNYAISLAGEAGEFWEEQRSLYDVPEAPESDIEIVTDSAVCQVAGRAYKKSLGLTRPAPDVHVVRVGRRYIVVDPNTTSGEFTLHVIFDLNFTEVSRFQS